MSTVLYRKYFPMVVSSAIAVLVMGEYFLTPGPIVDAAGSITTWAVIITTMAIFPGTLSILAWQYRAQKLAKTSWERFYPMVAYAFMVIFFLAATVLGVNNDTFIDLSQSILASAGTGIGIANGFWTFLCAVRAFRVRTLRGSLLFGATIIAMLGIAPWGFLTLGNWTTELSTWLVENISTPAIKGILMGASVGIVITGVRTLTGKEVAYLRGD